jgi:iron complex transport system ATP-binding protein
LQLKSDSNVLLSAKNLSWQVRRRLILDNVSFEVKQNEFVGIIGPNGAGKSSLLRCLYKKIIPSQGCIHFAGRTLNSYSRKALAQQLAVVLQEAPMRFELTVMDVIRMGLTPNKSLLSFDSPADNLAIINAAKQVDLADKLEQSMNSLSGGEKQRAMIARAILQAPRLLIMDEPTNHLDVRHQKEVLSLAKNLNITVIVSIHDLNLAAAYCDKLILLDEGKIVAYGSPEEVINQTTLKQVFAVDSLVDCHPFNQKLRITFDMGNAHD